MLQRRPDAERALCSFHLETNGFFHCRWPGGGKGRWGGGRIGPATVHLANLVAPQHNLRAERRAAGKRLSGTAEQTGALVEALSESIILGRTAPVHASALQQLQWSSCESLEQMLWATHGVHFHVPARTFRSLPDAQAAES